MCVGKGQRIQLRRHQQNRCHHDTLSAADVHVQDRAHLPTDRSEQPVDLGTGLLFWGRPHPDTLCLSHCFDLSCIAQSAASRQSKPSRAEPVRECPHFGHIVVGMRRAGCWTIEVEMTVTTKM
jgi:hypothetical protein